jgi:hypothetical protein
MAGVMTYRSFGWLEKSQRGEQKMENKDGQKQERIEKTFVTLHATRTITPSGTSRTFIAATPT